QPFMADFEGTWDPGGSGKHKRSHVIGPNGPADEGRNYVRRDAGIDRVAVVAELVRAVDEDSGAEKDVVLAHRKKQAGEIRRDEVPPAAENPIVRATAIFYHDLIGRQRLPTDVSGAPAP